MRRLSVACANLDGMTGGVQAEAARVDPGRRAVRSAPDGANGCCGACSPERSLSGPSASGEADGPLRHAVHLPPRPGRPVDWPEWVPRHRARRVRRPGGAAALEPPGAGGRAGAHRSGRGGGDRYGVGEVAGLPAAGAVGLRRRPAGDRPVPLAHQGAGRRPAAGARRARARGRAGRALRRRHPARRARLGPPARPVAVQQPGHAAPLAAAAARPLGRLSAAPALRGARRVPHLPRLVRLARGAAAAPPAAGLRPLRRPADDRAGVGDRGGAGRLRGAADGPRGGGRGRRRFARGRPDRRAVGTASARRADRGERCAGAPLRRCGVGPDAGRPRRRGRPHAGLRPLAAGRGADGARRPAGARRGGPRAGAAGVGVPRRLPAGGAAGAGGRAGPR